MRRALALAKVYGLIEPGPVVLLSSCRRGVPNVMAMSWHMMLEFEPPLIACVISDGNYSCKSVRKTGECVIAIPTVDIARKVVACGNRSGRDGNKFQAVGLTPLAAMTVSAPLIAECYANLECTLADASMVRRHGIFVWEVRKAWLDRSVVDPQTIHHEGYGNFFVSGRRMHIASRMR
jgi:flavin reductase (DIM6/NTAB) family NADH-FMN oxidoreductase RutF